MEVDAKEKKILRGTWPEHCEQRAFVDGAKWWEWHKEGATMWGSDVTLSEQEAIRRYGEPRIKCVFVYMGGVLAVLATSILTAKWRKGNHE